MGASVLTRRNFLAVTAATAAALLVGCSGENDEAPAADSTTEPVEDVPAADSAAAGNVLVAYFWWDEAAWPLRTFVEGNDFGDKTVVLFCTSGSSGIGGSADGLEELAGSGDWLEGERFSAGASDEAADWAAGLGL